MHVHPSSVVILLLAVTLGLVGCDVPPWETDTSVEVYNKTQAHVEIVKIARDDNHEIFTERVAAGSVFTVPVGGECDASIWEVRLLNGTVLGRYDPLCASDEIVIDPEDLPE